MGTPDILGTYGTFSYYTIGAVHAGPARTSRAARSTTSASTRASSKGKLYGPTNPFLVDAPKIAAPFTVYLDPDEPVAKLVVGSEERILKVGEWTDWVPVSLDLVPTQSVPVIARFYLK